MKLMIVDDEQIVRTGLKRIVTEEAPFFSEIYLAEDGEDALRLMETWIPDICVVDIRMRHMSGIDLIRQAQKKYSGIRFIVLSGYADFQYAQELMGLGCRKYLTKPVNHEELVGILCELRTEIAEERRNIEHLNEMESVSQENVSLKRERFLKHVFQNPAHPQSAEEFTQYGLAWLLQPFGAIVIGAECAPGIIIGALTDILSQERETEYCMQELTATEVLLLLRTTDISGIAERCCSGIRKITDAPFSVGTCSSIQDVHNAIVSAEIAMQSCFSEPERHLRSFEDTAVVPYRDFLQHENRIRDALFGGGSGLADGVDEMLQALSDEQVRSNICSVLICRMYLSVRTDLNNAGYEELLEQIPTYRSFETRMRNFHAFESMSSYVRSVFREIGRCIAANQDNDCRRLIQKAIRYINKNYARDISLSNIADYCSMNPSYFSQLFKSETGTTYMSYLTNTRIERAKHLLLSTPLKVYLVGQQVGYPDSKYFNRIFRQITGVTPNEFREQRQHQEEDE